MPNFDPGILANAESVKRLYLGRSAGTANNSLSFWLPSAVLAKRKEHVSREHAKGELRHRISAGSKFAIRLIFAQDSGKARHVCIRGGEEGSRLPNERDDKGSSERGKSDKVVPIRKRTLSAAARKKIAAAQRARWAKVKAGKKTA